MDNQQGDVLAGKNFLGIFFFLIPFEEFIINHTEMVFPTCSSLEVTPE